MLNQNQLTSSKLRDLFDAAQTARDLVGPFEAEYEPMEVNLGAEEHRLEERYTELESQFELFFTLDTEKASPVPETPGKIEYEESSATSVSEVNVEDSSLEPRDVMPFHGAWIGEQVAVGQEPVRAETSVVELVQRRQSEAWTRRPILSSSEDHSKRRLSSVEDPVQDELLADLKGITGTNEGDLVHLGNIKTEIGNILQSLAGVSSGSVDVDHDDFAPFPGDIDIDPSLKQSDSLLLAGIPPDWTLPASDYLKDLQVRQAPLREYLAKFGSTRDRVNLWMLHQLRLSRRETYELQRQVLIFAPEVVYWAESAVEEWSNDSLGQDQTYVAGSIEVIDDDSITAAHHIISPTKDASAQKIENDHKKAARSLVIDTASQDHVAG